jgi:HD superfamily phosphohydrolase
MVLRKLGWGALIGILFWVGCRAEIFPTLYGPVDVTEPLLLDLLHSPAMERARHIHVCGVIQYVHPSFHDFSRYDHCLGVFALLRLHGASIIEQAAGIAHDWSHTVFSHVGDVLAREQRGVGEKELAMGESYQDLIHAWFLKEMRVDEILRKYDLAIEDLLVTTHRHVMLDVPLPDLCADRIDYNIEIAFYNGRLSRGDIECIIEHLRYDHDAHHWFFTDPHAALLYAQTTLYNTEFVWGGVDDALIYRWTAKALARALDIGELTPRDINFSVDDEVWRMLMRSRDDIIMRLMYRTFHCDEYYKPADAFSYTQCIVAKFRGVDPLVFDGHDLCRLTQCNLAYKSEYNRVRALATGGWFITISGDDYHDAVTTPKMRGRGDS